MNILVLEIQVPFPAIMPLLTKLPVMFRRKRWGAIFDHENGKLIREDNKDTKKERSVMQITCFIDSLFQNELFR